VSAAADRAIFLDRDGTLIADVGYLSSPDRISLLPGVPGALADLKRAGFRLIVVTNQSAIARGRLTHDGLAAIHEEIAARIRAAGGPGPDAFYYCPHLPGAPLPGYARACECRKPAPGMILRAAAEWHVDTGRSYAVGDSERDVVAGRRAGCRTILLGACAACGAGVADATANDLAEAARLILVMEGEGGG